MKAESVHAVHCNLDGYAFDRTLGNRATGAAARNKKAA
jgi:hypothetical protein